MNDGPPPSFRFPVRLPIPCICCGGAVEMTTARAAVCLGCGVTQKKMVTEAERLRAVMKPERSDIEKAAEKLIPLSPYRGRRWFELRGDERQELMQAVRTVLKTLKG